ncbi:MAG: ABC transporter transmembrane domain-containing protein [Planctomycetota bacterium]
MRRIFEYVWPQWPRLIVVFVTAMFVAILLSFSLLTIIPLMKVMLGQEGLHGWVDRKACSWKYGVNFYLPDATDITSGENQDMAFNLLIISVEKDSLADAAGLRPEDKVVGAGENIVSEDVKNVFISKLLRELAGTSETEIPIQVKRFGSDEIAEVKLNTSANKEFIETLNWSNIRNARWSFQLALIDRAQRLVGFLPRDVSKESKRRTIVFIILGIGVLTLIRCLAKFCQDYMAHKVMLVAVNRMRQDTFSHSLDMPLSYFSKERPSDTVSRIIRDTNQVANSINIMLGRALREPMNALFMLICAMLLSWQLVLIFLCAAPFVLGLIALFGKKMKKASKRSLEAGSQMLSKLQQAMNSLKVVKVYNQQDYERKSFKTINSRLLKQLLKMTKIESATTPTLEVLGMFGGALALMVGVHWVTESRMEGTEFFLLLALLGAAAESVRKSSNVWNKIQGAKAAGERIFAVIDQPVEMEIPNAYTIQRLKEKIEFVDVTFTYPGEQSPVLKKVNLSVKAGHNVAIVGPNGSGKTTLANLIPRLYDTDSGKILIDGEDIHGAKLDSLRSQIAMVTQNIVTFNDTVAANIAYGRTSATMDQIIRAAKSSRAHEFIDALPDGYDTMIGEQGMGLSGGQLQRIVIARAILKDPAILIFDEATSQVDADSEAKIHDAIEEIMRDRTSFVIAHRFSTVITADIIVVMEDGQIIAQGTHGKLMDSCPLYQSLYKTQLVKA